MDSKKKIPLSEHYERLTPSEKKELLEELGIVRQTMHDWLQKPNRISAIAMVKITRFLNKKLQRNFTESELLAA